MSFTEDCLKAVLEKGLIGDTFTQARMVVANHGFNLLCSAWDDMLVARYDSATDHWRTIIETPRFLLALQLNAALASDMLAGKIKIETAVRTIRKGISKMAGPSDDVRWLDNMQSELSNVQVFSHVNIRASSAGFPKVEQGGKQIYFVVPGGGYISEELLALEAIYLTDAAVSLAAGVVFAFPEVPQITMMWKSSGRTLLTQTKDSLLEHARKLGVEA